MRPGVRIGIDVGKARVGVARSDFHGILATPVETVARSAPAASGGRPGGATGDGPGGSADVERILTIAREFDAVEFIVGLPLSMSGGDTLSTGDARSFALLLATAAGHPVRMIDERLTTVSAQAALHRSGRTTKNSRSVIDQVAAVILLQHALDVERSSGNPPGLLVEPNQGIHSD